MVCGAGQKRLHGKGILEMYLEGWIRSQFRERRREASSGCRDWPEERHRGDMVGYASKEANSPRGCSGKAET